MSIDINYLDHRIVRLARMLSISPTGAKKLVKIRRVARHFWAVLRRRSMARKLLATSGWSKFIPPDQGYRLLAPDSLAGSQIVVATCRALFEAKGGMDTFLKGKKPFFTNILTEQDLAEHPEILDFVVSDAVIESVTGYLGTVPRLNSVGLFVSAANETTTSSQLYHFDGDDFHIVKCFYNLADVAPDNGPFTFLPKQASQRVSDGLGAYWGHGRFEDQDIEKFCPPGDAVSLTGEAGNGAFVDTAGCMHFGSRARAGYRIVLMFLYSPHPNVKLAKGKADLDGMPVYNLPTERYRDDLLRRMVLGLDA